MKDHIARIVLFGSVLDGGDQPGSDVDVLVIGTDRLRELSEACAAASFDTAMQWGESVEPLVYCTDDMRFPQSYFLYDTLRRGKEIYRMDEEMLRRKEAEAALALAREYLASAEDAAAHRHYRLAVDGAYNSAELAIKGLLHLIKLERMPSSHGGTVQMFGKHYVVTGLVAPEQGHKLNVHLELRNKARYDFHARITQDDARDTLALAKEFIAFLEAQLQQAEN
jgi:uncharacterized protein (UPF0332 family)